MRLLSALLAFVRLQDFSPADASLFNTLVASLSKCLAHQASISASFNAFLGLKRRNFYLSYLPAYFSEANKRAMLAAPLVCASSLSAESDVARLLADTQTSSALCSQQALVDVASRGFGARRRSSSPYRSPAGLLLLAVAVVVLALLFVLRKESVLTLLLSPLLFRAASRVFNCRGHVPHPVWLGLV